MEERCGFLHCVCLCTLSCVQLFAAPWTVACQAPLSMGPSKQECCRGRHFLLQGAFPTRGLKTETVSTASPAVAGGVLIESTTAAAEAASLLRGEA